MTTKNKLSKNAKQESSASEENKKHLAAIYNNPIVSSSLIVKAMHKNPEVGVEHVLDDMMHQIDAFREKGVKRIESILISQAHALQSIFERAAIQIGNPASLEALQVWGVIALKTQEQTRKTLATLMDIKNPKRTSFIKQQNNAVNQQIITHPENSKIPEQKSKNELLGVTHVLDTGTPFKTIPANPQMEALETIDRR